MSNATTDTQFQVEEVGFLQNGRIGLVGVYSGDPVRAGMHGVVTTIAGELKVEVISVALVRARPNNPNRKLLQATVQGGDPKSLKSHTLHLK